MYFSSFGWVLFFTDRWLPIALYIASAPILAWLIRTFVCVNNNRDKATGAPLNALLLHYIYAIQTPRWSPFHLLNDVLLHAIHLPSSSLSNLILSRYKKPDRRWRCWRIPCVNVYFQMQHCPRFSMSRSLPIIYRHYCALLFLSFDNSRFSSAIKVNWQHSLIFLLSFHLLSASDKATFFLPSAVYILRFTTITRHGVV